MVSMKQLKVKEKLEGLEIRFPGNGLPNTTPAGKVYKAIFWACCFSPIMLNNRDISNPVFTGLFIAALITAMVVLLLRSRKLRLLLTQDTLSLSSPNARYAIPLDEITDVASVTEKEMSLHYVTVTHDGETISIDTLLKKEDADWLVNRLNTAIQARKTQLEAAGELERVRPPTALQEMLKAQ